MRIGGIECAPPVVLQSADHRRDGNHGGAQPASAGNFLWSLIPHKSTLPPHAHVLHVVGARLGGRAIAGACLATAVPVSYRATDVAAVEAPKVASATHMKHRMAAGAALLPQAADERVVSR
jgi:hypothetical protein